MTAMRTFVVPIAALCASALMGCSGGDSATDAPAAGTTVATSTVESTTATPAVKSTTATPASEESTATPPEQTPEEAADLVPGGAPFQPSGNEAGNVDPAVFLTEPGKYNFTSPTGNLHCGIWASDGPEGRVGCQAEDGRNPVEGAQCSNAANDKVAIRVTGAGSGSFCTTQGIYVDQNALVLDVGQVLSVDGVVCKSGPDDIIACTAPTGGFTFSRDINYTY